MFKQSVIVPINTNVYNTNVLKRLSDIYTSTNIYLSIMGPDVEDVLNLIDEDKIEYIIKIPSPDFNYAYSVNRVLSHLITEGHPEDEIIAISDSLIAFSMVQMNKEIENLTKSKNEIITVDIIRDDEENPVNMESKRLMLSILARIRLISPAAARNTIFQVPILKLGCIKEINGLEETLITDISRKYLIDNLLNSGYKRIETEQLGLFINYEYAYPKEYLEIDKSIINEKNKVTKDYVIPNNLGETFGDPAKMKRFIIKNNIPVWKESLPYRVVSEPEDEDDEKIKPTNKEIEEIFPDENIKYYKLPVLLLLDNDISDVISATPLIRKLFLSHGPIEILSNSRKFPFLELLGKKFIKKIWFQDDIHTGNLDISKYKTIIRASGCSIKLQSNIKVIENSTGNTKSEMNYNIINGVDCGLLPYCIFDGARKTLPSNTITVAATIKPTNPDDTYEEMLVRMDEIVRHIVNSGLNILILTVDRERPYGNFIPLLKKKNVFRLDNLKIGEYGSILNQSSFIITTETTDLFWLSYGLKKQTFVLKPFQENYITAPLIPKCDWMIYCKHDDENLPKKIERKICERI